MGELEDLKKEIARLNRVCNDWRERYLRKCNEVDKMKDIVSVTPQPRMGYWIYDKVDMNGYYLDDYECSVCKCSKNVDTPYCPMCGAKMEVKE